MHDVPDVLPVVTPPLGPGDSDPRDAVQPMAAVTPPLGPGAHGDDETPAELPELPPVPGPGDGPESEWIVRAPAPLLPGAMQVPQPAVRVRRKTTGA